MIIPHGYGARTGCFPEGEVKGVTVDLNWPVQQPDYIVYTKRKKLLAVRYLAAMARRRTPGHSIGLGPIDPRIDIRYINIVPADPDTVCNHDRHD